MEKINSPKTIFVNFGQLWMVVYTAIIKIKTWNSVKLEKKGKMHERTYIHFYLAFSSKCLKR